VHDLMPENAIAIVGLAGRWPGAPNIERFWRNLSGAVESISFFTDEELEASGIDPVTLPPNYVKARAILEAPEWFDAAFFGYTPTAHRIRRDEPDVPIGRPLANTQVRILDQHLRPVPVGVTGELFVGGAGVATGYWKRSDLTAERFVSMHFDGEPATRFYRTGDLARLGLDGCVRYLVRADHQIKLRGFRIELGEIEAVLARHAGVRETGCCCARTCRGISGWWPMWWHGKAVLLQPTCARFSNSGCPTTCCPLPSSCCRHCH